MVDGADVIIDELPLGARQVGTGEVPGDDPVGGEGEGRVTVEAAAQAGFAFLRQGLVVVEVPLADRVAPVDRRLAHIGRVENQRLAGDHRKRVPEDPRRAGPAGGLVIGRVRRPAQEPEVVDVRHALDLDQRVRHAALKDVQGLDEPGPVLGDRGHLGDRVLAEIVAAELHGHQLGVGRSRVCLGRSVGHVLAVGGHVPVLSGDRRVQGEDALVEAVDRRVGPG